MNISTEALINKAIETNSEIQEDNLIMLNICNDLCRKARTVEQMKKIDKIVSTEDFDKLTITALDYSVDFCHQLNLDKEECLKLNEADRRALLHSSIERFINDTKASISSTLINMVETSIKDMFNKTDFETATKLPSGEVFTYSKEAIETIADSFYTIVQNIGFINDNKFSFSTIMNTFADKLEAPMSMVHTKIGYEGFVSIDVPQPKVQTMDQANITCVSELNEISDALNTITYKEMRERVGKIKQNIVNRINECNNVEDTVKSIHFMAQMLMSVKNSITLMKNYHKATLNESK